MTTPTLSGVDGHGFGHETRNDSLTGSTDSPPTESSGPPPLPPLPEPSLTSTTAHGFLWATVATVGSKLVATVGQIALAWLLTKEDFGWVALALAIAAFPAMLHAGGVSSVLVQRQHRSRLYANACFWLGLTLALLAAAIILVAAPIAAALSHSSTLAWLLVVTAANTVITGLAIVPLAMLQIRLRFKTIAMVNATNTILQMIAAVPLAWMGMGPFSVVLATTIGTVGTLIYCWRSTRPPVRLSMQLRRWKYLIGDTATLLSTNMVWTIAVQGDRLILGSIAGKTQLGVYYFANNLSMQVCSLLTTNLSGVLFPTFSRLTDDPARQLRAFLRAARVMALVGVPATLLQAALADPVLRILFKEKWVEAIPVMQWFSVGMAAYVVSGALTSLLMAQRRFRMLLWIALTYLPVFLIAFVLGVLHWGAVGGAAAVCSCYWLSSLISMTVAVRRDGGTLQDVLGIYAFPVLASIAALSPGILLARLVPGGPWHHIVRVLAIGGSMAAIYPALSFMLGGAPAHDLRGIAHGLARKLRRA